MAADQSAELRLDYDQTVDFLRGLTDVRFKLLAFVPTISGAAIGLLGHGRSAAELLSVGLLGLVATLGVVLYELRNTQLCDYAILRAKGLEARLGLSPVFGGAAAGGLFTERPGHDIQFFGFAAVGYDRALALVYGAAIGGWCYVVAWGGLRALGVAHAREAGGAIGVVLGLAVLVEFLRIDGRPHDEAPVPRPAAAGPIDA